MSGIGGRKFAFRQPLLFLEEKVGGGFPESRAEGRGMEVRELGQKDPFFFLVAVGSPGLTAVCFVYIGAHALMDSLIFFRQIVVIFVIAIEVFQRTQKEGGSQKQLTVGNFCTDGIASEEKGAGEEENPVSVQDGRNLLPGKCFGRSGETARRSAKSS